jgi:hypothetical protein
MQLMERVVLTKTGKGIRQGGNLSPLLLNLYLHHLLDRRWQRQHPDMALLRWADDLLVLCRTQEQAQQAYNDLQRLLLPIGMTLKGTAEQAIHNLGNGNPAIWLGYQLLRDGGGLKVSLTEDAWQSLTQNLELCHTKPGSPLRAVETILGWISQLGPCYLSTDIYQAYARISELAHSLAFDEIPSKEGIRRHWHQAHIRWEDSQRAQRSRASSCR